MKSAFDGANFDGANRQRKRKNKDLCAATLFSVRLILAGSGRRRDQVTPGWFSSGRGSRAFHHGRE